MRYRVQREIVEIFEVEAASYDEAVEKVAGGEVEESFPLADRYELVEEIPERDPDHLNPAEGGNRASDDYW